MLKPFPVLAGAILFLASCSKNETSSSASSEPKLIFKFRFDSTQQRLNNIGQSAAMPPGHAGLNPAMNRMSAHYIELAPSAFTAIGAGAVLYKASETNIGGANAINFSQSVFAADGEQFYAIPLKNITVGQYQYLRVSLAYQNFDVKFHLDTTINVPPAAPVTISQDFPGTVASFVGFNSYITTHTVKTSTITVNGNRKQGYWAFETSGSISGFPFSYVADGQSPDGATTVVNPINATSPIPAGSCLVTGAFAGGKLTIAGNETKDIVVVVSLSTNKSFEWVDANSNGKWDATKGEQVVDMGLRGLIPTVQ
jgi:hypothetical protein